MIKNINSYYNSSITFYFENNDTDIDLLLYSIGNSIGNSIDSNIILKIIDYYVDDIPSSIYKETEKDLNNLIRCFGYRHIKSMISYLYSPNYFNKNIIDLINELNDIVIPISYNIFNVTSTFTNGDYYWRIPTKYESNDLLQKKRELWIKLKNNKYLKIDLIFKIDKFLTKLKTTQLKSQILQKHKINIINRLENISIDSKFIKSFIRHDYMGNIYCMSEIEYVDYITKMYNKYTKLIESTFVNIMKDFVNQENPKKCLK